MLTLDRRPKLSSDLLIRPTVKGVKGKRKVKFQTCSNGKSSSVNVFVLDKHQKLSTVTSLSYG